MTIVISFLVVFTVFIYAVSTIFSLVLFKAKDTINPPKYQQSQTNQKDLEKVLNSLSWSSKSLPASSSAKPSDIKLNLQPTWTATSWAAPSVNLKTTPTTPAVTPAPVKK